MKSFIAIFIALLGIAFLSYGVSVSDAQSAPNCGSNEVVENNECVPAFVKTPTSNFTIMTGDSNYTVGESISVTGSIPVYDGTYDITIRVFDPTNNLVTVKQLKPDSSGNFSVIIPTGAFWKSDGMYKIIANYGQYITTESSFQFIALTCGSDEIIQNGQCIKKSQPKPKPIVETPTKPKPENKTEPPTSTIKCGNGTVLVDNQCIPETTTTTTTTPDPPRGGGCLVATAAYGTEFSSQVQMLRELRDSTLLETSAGSSFMTEFNQIYYSFSPAIADLERSNPIVKSTIQILLAPMLSSLSLLDIVQPDSESQVLTAGVSIILLNILLYIGAPIFIIYNIRRMQTPKLAKI